MQLAYRLRRWVTSSRRWAIRRGGPSSTSSPSATARRCSSLRAARGEARARLEPSGDLPAPRRAGGRGARPSVARGPLQAALDRPATARAHGAALASTEKGPAMRIHLTSVLVDDQDKALRFYTQVLGFQTKTEIPLGEHRWLTVVSPAEPDGVELVLEPDEHPAARPFKDALVADGIPFTSFAVDDVDAEFERLRALGVRFTQEPANMGPVTTAVLDDTCGNLIQLAQLS